jgi:hypothetical protein
MNVVTTVSDVCRHQKWRIQMKVRNLKMTTAALLLATSLVSSACSVQKTKDGKAPEVHVSQGELPEYDVDTADVDVKMEDKTVTVPDVDVKTKEKTVSVPDVDVNMPNR